MAYFTYILCCSDGTFYCGYTNDLSRRISTHNRGKGAKYTRSRLPVKLVYMESFSTKREALQREWKLKQLSHAQKQALIATGLTK